MKGGQKPNSTLPISPATLKTEDSVLIEKHTAGPFHQVYVGDYEFFFINGIKLNPFQLQEVKQRWYIF